MHIVEVYPTLTPALTAVIMDNLRTLLPKPVAGSDTEEARAEREQVAMSAVAALYPADTFEAILAAQIIACDAHAKHCMAAAAALDGVDDMKAAQCRNQASSMLRYMQSGQRSLERRQKQRAKDEGAQHPAAAPAEPPKLTELSEEELYATTYPQRAAEIRRHGGLPPRVSYGPREPALVQAIVRSTSPILLALDQSETRPPLNVQTR